MASSSVPPSVSASPRSARPRRPWYLNVALLLAWLTGALTAYAGVDTLRLFHVAPDEVSLQIDRQPDLSPEERARQKDAIEAIMTALHAAKNRVVPLAVAELLLGGAMIVFVHSATIGRSWARQALIQLTVAHIGLAALEWRLTPDVRASVNDFARGSASDLGIAASSLDRKHVSDESIGLAGLGLSVTFSMFTLLGLTLRGSRAFYGESGPLSDS
jgi:hypothetical protein